MGFRLFKRGRMPRRWKRGAQLIRRKDNGRLYAVHHGGFAESIRALFCNERSFWFIPVRRYRGRLIAAIDVAWHPHAGDFEIIGTPENVLCVGRKASLPIDDGGLA